MVQPSSGEEASFTVFMPTDDAFNSFETFDPDMYARIMNDPDLWRQVRPHHSREQACRRCDVRGAGNDAAAMHRKRWLQE